MQTRRRWVVVAFLLAMLTPLFAATAFAQSGADKLPNIVIILADDLGYGDVQAFNPESTIETPNLNRLAAQGMSFTDAHSPSAVCTPTRYALLTGRYSWRTRMKRGVLNGYSPPLIEPGRKTIGDLLQKAGYRTGAVGKWHLGMDMPRQETKGDPKKQPKNPAIDFAGTITNGPTHHGFDRYFGVSASLDMPPYVYIDDDRFAAVPTLEQPAMKFPHFVRAGPRSEDFVLDECLDRLADEAVDFIRGSATSGAPFFLYMPLTGPHKPALPHDRFRGCTRLKEYGDFVHQVDWTVGKVLQALDEAGVADDTAVFLSSDNGSYMYRYDEPGTKDHVDDVTVQGFRPENHRANGPLRGTKADIWEAGHRVPCLVRWPRYVDSGVVCDTTVCLTDLYATCADIVAAELGDQEGEDSVSWLPFLQGKSGDRGTPVIHQSGSGMLAIRDGKWKLVAGNGSGGRQQPRGKALEKPYQLFDLSNDLSEQNNLAGEYPEIVEQLTKRLEDLVASDRSVTR